MIYADCAATAMPNKKAMEAMQTAYSESWGNPSSAHKFGQDAREKLEDARARIARCINCKPCEIYFTSGGTESNNIAIYSATNAGRVEGKTHIVSSSIEHPSVLEPIRYLEWQGFRVTWVQPDAHGIISLSDFLVPISGKTCLSACMALNNETGHVFETVIMARFGSSPTLVDAVQAVGHVPIDVQKIGCTYLSMSAHKFGGPYGIGALYVKNGAPISPLILGGGQESGIRSGTENVPGAVGMAVALEDSCSRMEHDLERLGELYLLAKHELQKIEGCHFDNEAGSHYPGIMSVRFDGVEASSLVLLLSEYGVFVSAGSACHAGSNEPSHVLMKMGLTREMAMSTIRISISPEMTADDIVSLCRTVGSCVSALRTRA